MLLGSVYAKCGRWREAHVAVCVCVCVVGRDWLVELVEMVKFVVAKVEDFVFAAEFLADHRAC
jgi:hypothetical protein